MEKLYDALLNQKVYEEVALKMSLSKSKLANYFPRAKNQLYQIILEVLDEFYAEKNTLRQLQKELHQVQILFLKGLLRQCNKRL